MGRQCAPCCMYPHRREVKQVNARSEMLCLHPRSGCVLFMNSLSVDRTLSLSPIMRNPSLHDHGPGGWAWAGRRDAERGGRQGTSERHQQRGALAGTCVRCRTQRPPWVQDDIRNAGMCEHIGTWSIGSTVVCVFDDSCVLHPMAVQSAATCMATDH